MSPPRSLPRPGLHWILGASGGVAIAAAGFVAGKALFSHGHTTLPPPSPASPSGPPKPLPPPVYSWSETSLNALLAAIDSSRDEGLLPSDYRRGAIAGAVQSHRTGPDVDMLASDTARQLAHDYADGRITHRARFDWHIDPASSALAALDADLGDAVKADRVGSYLQSLLPQDARYAALRTALRETPASATGRLDHIRASMERWRWMPRRLGADYVMVNVPAYRLALYHGDVPVVTHDVVVGAPETPTPLLSATIGSIVLNPSWTLPPAVLKEGKGKSYSPARGFFYVKTASGRTMIRQKPGPLNALGRVKIDMPNPYAIYLHDTPAKWGFAKADRALSHGCIRVKDIATLAARLGDPAAVDAALETYDTHTLKVEKGLPVYIVYFTAGPDADGKIVTYADPYDRDAQLIAEMDKPASPKTVATITSAVTHKS